MAEKETGSGQVQQRCLLATFDRTLDFAKSSVAITKEHGALVGGVVFFASCLLNYYVFRTWGLSFFELATPADVVLTGLAAIRFVVPIAVAIAGPVLVTGLLLFIVRPFWFSTVNFIKNGKVKKVVGDLFLLATLVSLMCIPIVGAYTMVILDLNESQIEPLLWIISFVVMLFFEVARGREARDGEETPPTIPEYKRKRKTVLVLISIAVVTLYVVNRQALKLTLKGYGDTTNYVGNANLSDCIDPVVLWVGENAVVGKCQNGSIMAFLDRDNLVVRPTPMLSHLPNGS